jgi:hypothetical protein
MRYTPTKEAGVMAEDLERIRGVNHLALAGVVVAVVAAAVVVLWALGQLAA